MMNFFVHVLFLIFINVGHILFSTCQEHWINPHIIKLSSDQLHITLNAFNREFVLDLKQKSFLSANYNEVTLFSKHNYTQQFKTSDQPDWCHYQGSVLGTTSSRAAISYCGGKLNGVFEADGVAYHILQPNRTSRVKIFLDTTSSPYQCGFENNLDSSELKRVRRDLPDESHLLNITRYVELVIVNDYKVYTKYGKNSEFIFERSKQIVNVVNSLYSSLNIVVALVGVVIWTEKNEIEVTSDSSQTLNNFLKYRRDSLIKMFPNDNAQLITGTSFESGIVGKALKQTLCTYEYSGGVNSDYSENLSLVATTMAHELGHNFGMEHDNNDCDCPDKPKPCIMGPSSSFPSPRHWSSCSIKQLLVGFKHGIDHCLFNKPLSIFKPSCGNGLVDPGEECDCGLADTCKNKCCNASTCKLIPGAECANGDCCDKHTCKVISAEAGHVCRAAKSLCDLPEKCDGSLEHCPRDLIVKDGTECLPGYAYCYGGHCSAREEQCKLLWGKSGEVADYRCYQHNLNASSSGNCGYNKAQKKFINCDEVKDIICGRLHCTHRSEKLEYGPEGAAIISKSVEFRKGKLVSCYSAIIDLGLNEMDPGLVPNGAKCATNSMCVEQRCMPVNKYLLNKPCPYNCNNNGYCDNEGNCHCFDGFNSNDCSAYNNRYFLTVSIYVLFLFILPLLTLSAFLLFNNQQRIKSWFRQKTLSSHDYNNQKRKKLPLNLVISGPVDNQQQIMTYTSADSQISAPAGAASILKPIRPAPPRPPPAKANNQIEVEMQFASLHLDQNTLRKSSTRRPKKPPPEPPATQLPLVCDSPADSKDEDPGVKKLILMFDHNRKPH